MHRSSDGRSFRTNCDHVVEVGAMLARDTVAKCLKGESASAKLQMAANAKPGHSRIDATQSYSANWDGILADSP